MFLCLDLFCNIIKIVFYFFRNHKVRYFLHKIYSISILSLISLNKYLPCFKSIVDLLLYGRILYNFAVILSIFKIKIYKMLIFHVKITLEGKTLVAMPPLLMYSMLRPVFIYSSDVCICLWLFGEYSLNDVIISKMCTWRLNIKFSWRIDNSIITELDISCRIYYLHNQGISNYQIFSKPKWNVYF